MNVNPRVSGVVYRDNVEESLKNPEEHHHFKDKPLLSKELDGVKTLDLQLQVI